MEEYFPLSPENKNAEEYNKNLPGLGGVFNSRNLQTYHYAGNNPLKYTDPTGEFHYDPWQENNPEYQAMVEYHFALIQMMKDQYGEDVYDETYRIETLEHIRIIRKYTEIRGWVLGIGGGVGIHLHKLGQILATKTLAGTGFAVAFIDIILAKIENDLERHPNPGQSEDLVAAKNNLISLKGMIVNQQNLEKEIADLESRRNASRDLSEVSSIDDQLEQKRRDLTQQQEAIDQKKREMGMVQE